MFSKFLIIFGVSVARHLSAQVDMDLPFSGDYESSSIPFTINIAPDELSEFQEFSENCESIL